MTGMKDARLTPLGDERVQQIEALIARLTAAIGPDLALDDSIAEEIGEWRNLGGWWREHKVTGERERYNYRQAPLYTSSIDAALTLVPEQMFVGLRRFSDGWYAAVALKSDLEDKGVWRGNQKPAPLAICIAALKARQSIAEQAPQGAQPTHTKGDQ